MIDTNWAALVPQQVTSQDHDTYITDGDRVVETNGIDWCGRGDSHVDFEKNELLPLREDRFLGHGARGAVYSTRCQGGRVVAWKKIYCPRGITQAERKEIVVLKRLNHKHIIHLVGSYTQRPYLGLLLWPVATTDLAKFLEGIDGFTTHLAMSTSSYDAEEAKHFIQEVVGARTPARYLRHCIGCLASAVGYLHSNSIRHKDLKPANVLLYPDGLRLTDFGTATDFTDFSQSATEGGDRGTPKYFSPETSAFEPCGRASDIFSLGCIFLEVLAVANGYSLEQLKQSRPDKDRSFQANIEQVRNWIRTAKFKDWDILLLGEIGLMLHAVPGSRPTIEDIQHRLEYVEILSGTSPHSTYLANCCKLNHYNCQEDRPSIATAITFDLRIGNVLVRPSWHLTIMAEDGDFIHRLKSMPDVGVGYTVARSPFKAHASVFSKSSQQASVLELELLSSSTPTRETLYSGYDLPPPEDLITLGTTFGKPENEHDSSSSLRRGKRVTKVDRILPSKEQKHAVQQFLDQLSECNHNAHFDVLWITMDNQETPQRLALVVTQALSSKLEGSTESDYSPQFPNPRVEDAGHDFVVYPVCFTSTPDPEPGVRQLISNVPPMNSTLPSQEDHTTTNIPWPPSNAWRGGKETVSSPSYFAGLRKVNSSLDLSPRSSPWAPYAGYTGTSLVTCCYCGQGPCVKDDCPSCLECGHQYCSECAGDEV